MTWPKPQPGDPLRIPASLQGRLIDLASAPGGPGLGRGGSPVGTPLPPGVTLLGRNTAQSFIPAFGVARIAGSAVDAGESLRQFIMRPVLDLAPAESDDDVLVIAANRINPGGLGQVYVSGIVQARVIVTDEQHGYARPRFATPWALESSAEPGPIRLIWKQGGTGTVWALAMIGSASSGPTDLVRALIVSSKKEPGDIGYTYTLARATGVKPWDWVGGGELDPAYNTFEAVGFDGFEASPIADGVGVLASKHGDAWYFSTANVEGVCQL